MVNGRYVVCALPGEATRIIESHNHNIDLIATDEVSDIPDDVKIIVERGSSMYKNHPNRIEVWKMVNIW